MLREITVSLPPMIARRDVPFSAALASEVESAVQEITALDNSAGETLDALRLLLLRTESVASSKIERVQASLEDFARALHGIKTNPSAVSMVAATRALTPMVGKVGETGVIDLETITDSHAALMIGEPAERDYAGRLRDMQNWVGGSDHSPRAAVFVPPPPDTVQSYLEDLISFSNRDDLPVLVQAAIAHAQFESIHPFIDGNGRIGRACGRGEAHRNSSRGHPEPVEVRDRAGPRRQRHGKLLAHLLDRPILSGEDACTLLETSTSATYNAIERLHSVGVLRPSPIASATGSGAQLLSSTSWTTSAYGSREQPVEMGRRHSGRATELAQGGPAQVVGLDTELCE